MNRQQHFRNLTGLLLTATLASCADSSGVSDEQLAGLASEIQAECDSNKSWATIRAERQATLDAYLASHDAGFKAFLYGPIGVSGVPKLLLEKFPLVFPDLWGPPAEKLAKVGLGPDPFDAANPLPLGLGTATANGIELAAVTCATCHVGRVIGPDGAVIHLVGGPNTQFNQFRTVVERTVADPRYAIFGSNPLTNGFKTKVLQRRGLIDATLGAFTYSPARFPDAPDLHNLEKPGFLDAIGVGLPILAFPEILDPALAPGIVAQVMPHAPAQVDIPSVWNQQARTVAQWDGAIPNPIYRNLAAEVGALGVASAVSYANAAVTAVFSQELPSPPYPFDVDIHAAKRGAKLFAKHCFSCHVENNDYIYPTSATGTDPNRTFTISDGARPRLIALLKSLCTDADVCAVPDDQIIRDFAVTGRGYVAPPLDGIWARAPYLHNGAVPTLYHLLVPSSRPATFVRGDIHYDTDKVGYAWDDAAAAQPYTFYFDSTESGASNAGHDSPEFLGIDWKQHPKKLRDLLEFLKML